MSVGSEKRAGPDGPGLEIEIEPDAQAPSIARAAVRGFTDQRGLEPTVTATLTLLVSEIVTNAVIHPKPDHGSKITLRAWQSSGTLRVEVLDHGAGFNPAPRDPARIAGGYGLFLLEKQAARWGVERRDGTAVWFELGA